MGKVKASEVALVTGNHVRGGSTLQPRTLASVLASLGEFGAYAGLPAGCDLSSPALDEEVSIRFQTVFLPVADEALGALEFTSGAAQACVPLPACRVVDLAHT